MNKIILKESTYTTSQVAKIAGLSIHVLRAWEKRYNVVSPIRFGEHRGYSHQDVERLVNLKKMVDSGITIGKACVYSNDEISSILNLKQSGQDLLVSSLIEQLSCQKWIHFQQDLEKLCHKENPDTFILNILIPLLTEIGHQVEAKILTIGHEHYASSCIRDLIVKIPNPPIQKKYPFMTFSTPEGDYHELGILMAAKLASLRGIPIIYLGPHVPALSLFEVISQFSPALSVISASSIKNNFQSFGDYLNVLSEKMKTIKKCKTQMLIAGELSLALSQDYQTHSSMDEWIETLNSWEQLTS